MQGKALSNLLEFGPGSVLIGPNVGRCWPKLSQLRAPVVRSRPEFDQRVAPISAKFDPESATFGDLDRWLPWGARSASGRCVPGGRRIRAGRPQGSRGARPMSAHRAEARCTCRSGQSSRRIRPRLIGVSFDANRVVPRTRAGCSAVAWGFHMEHTGEPSGLRNHGRHSERCCFAGPPTELREIPANPSPLRGSTPLGSSRRPLALARNLDECLPRGCSLPPRRLAHRPTTSSLRSSAHSSGHDCLSMPGLPRQRSNSGCGGLAGRSHLRGLVEICLHPQTPAHTAARTTRRSSSETQGRPPGRSKSTHARHRSATSGMHVYSVLKCRHFPALAHIAPTASDE